MLRSLCLLLLLVAHGAAGQARPVVDPARGWFFYDDPAHALKQSTRRVDPAAPPPPPALSAEWFRAEFPKIQDRAIDDPTEDNVELYLRVQQVMVDKADQFSSVVRRVQTLMPELDEQQRTPSNKAAKSAVRTASSEALAKVLERLRGEIGLIYYFSSSCPYCAKQGPILDVLRRTTGLEVMAVSLDGRPMADGTTPHWIPDTGQAAQLGVRVTPTVLLAHPASGRIVPLVQGLRTADQIIDAIVEIGKASQLITDAEYTRIRSKPEASLVVVPKTSAPIGDASDLLRYLRAVEATSQPGSATAVETSTGGTP